MASVEFLSQRGNAMKESNQPFDDVSEGVFGNIYDPKTNQTGIVDLSCAENYTSKDIIAERFTRPDMKQWEEDFRCYDRKPGVRPFESALANFITEHFKAYKPIDPQNLYVMTGCRAVLDCLASTLADPGDYILLPTPTYAGFWFDVCFRTGVNLFEVPLKGREVSSPSDSFKLTGAILETYYQKAVRQGCKVRGILLVNPLNPVGTVLGKDALLEVMEFAAKHKIHVIADEIYALSVYDESVEFFSLLSLPSIPDPERLHVIWSFSKDMGLSGIRCGFLHTTNQHLKAIVGKYASFHPVPLILKSKLTIMLEDKDWLNRTYFPTVLSRLKASRHFMTAGLEELGLKVYPSTAGLYLLVDFSSVIQPLTFDAEMSFAKRLVRQPGSGVLITPGKVMGSTEPGWFRIVFTHDEVCLKEALNRMKKVIDTVALENMSLGADAQDVTNINKFQSAAGTGNESLEDLITKLRVSLQDSEWLERNTAEKWQTENPDLAKAFMEARENNPLCE